MSPVITRPVVWFIIVALVVLLYPILMVITWYVFAQQVENSAGVVSMDSIDTNMDLLSNIKGNARSLLPINLSTLRLARTLNSALNGSLSSFSTIESQVAPDLFLVFSSVPNLSQISFFVENGLFVSYHREKNHTLALFANMSYASSASVQNSSISYQWYRRPINGDTGMLFGDEIDLITPVIFTNASWFYNALTSTVEYSSWGLEWSKDQESLFFSVAPIKENLPTGEYGVVSIGVPVKVFTKFIANLNLRSGFLYLATEDGHFLQQTGPPNTSMMFSNGTLTVQSTSSKDNVVEAATINLSCNLNHSDARGTLLIASNVKIWGTRYEFYCDQLDLGGVRLVFVLMIPHKGLVSLGHKQYIVALLLLLLTLALAFPMSCLIIVMHMRAIRKEVVLGAALIKQMEATQQAERKSMNKSIAFASASHDVRTSLAAITGLIDLSLSSFSPKSEVHTNLMQMKSCAANLLGILNSVLDTSKIEAGKMQLEEEQFDLAQLLEEAVEMFYVVASKKGLDVMLDPCDVSVQKHPFVIGDCGRLKQIVHNLLSNAVKFTSEGHVVVRAWIRKPSSENSILASNQGGCFSNLRTCMSQLIFKDGDAFNNLGSVHTVQQNSNFIEFVVEVDDTGKGIPKEKHKSVFENFVQVKESSSEGHQGTGLGLGIVQSLVRLMGGEINIVDKVHGEKGTCFRFNVFLHSCEVNFSDAEDIKSQKDLASSEIACSSKAMLLRKGFKLEGLHAILLVQGNEGGLIAQRWVESHGIKVWPINQWEHLYPTIEKLKRKTIFNHSSASGKFDSSSLLSYSGDSVCYSSNEGEKDDYPLSSNMTAKDLPKKTSQRSSPSCILVIVDMTCGYFAQTCSVLARFSKNAHDLPYEVVWLVNPNTPHTDLKSLENKQAPCDLILQKPFHGSRVYALLQWLQDCRDVLDSRPNDIKIKNVMQGAQDSIKLGSPRKLDPVAYDSTAPQSSSLASSRNGLEGNASRDKTLSGVNVLVAEDNIVLRRLAIATLSRLGATVEYCENGEDALNLVRKGLQGISNVQDGSQSGQGTPKLAKKFPYDIILMDCEMPIMNGYEATKHIRMEERQYDLHIPIIALTAHAMAEEVKKTLQAGMDFHLTKPLSPDQLLEAIHNVKNNN